MSAGSSCDACSGLSCFDSQQPVQEFELLLDDANHVHDAWVALFSAARKWTQRTAIRRQRRQSKRMRAHRNPQPEELCVFEASVGEVAAAFMKGSDSYASGSESAALPESLVVPGGTQSVNPVVVLGGPGFDGACRSLRLCERGAGGGG